MRASVSVNRELVLLYWRIGRDILLRQAQENWGTKVINRLAADLKRAFPEMRGFSPRTSEYRLAEALPASLKGSLPTVEELEAELGKNEPNDS